MTKYTTNYIIREVLNGHQIVCYEEFRNAILEFRKKMTCYIDNFSFSITLALPNNILGRCREMEYIKINDRIVRRMYAGDKMAG